MIPSLMLILVSLQDLILAAINEAMKMADEASANMMGRMTGGMGGGFPF